MRRRTWGGSAARLRRCLRSLQHAAGRGVLRCQKRSLPSSSFGTACGVAGSYWGKFGDKRIKRGGQANHGDLQRVETRQMPAHGRDIAAPRPVPALARTSRSRKKRARAAYGAGTSTRASLGKRAGAVCVCARTFGALSVYHPKSSGARAKTNQRRLVVLKARRFTGTIRHLRAPRARVK